MIGFFFKPFKLYVYIFSTDTSFWDFLWSLIEITFPKNRKSLTDMKYLQNTSNTDFNCKH